MKREQVKVGQVVKDKAWGYVRVCGFHARNGEDRVTVYRSEGLGLADSRPKDLRPLTARERGE